MNRKRFPFFFGFVALALALWGLAGCNEKKPPTDPGDNKPVIQVEAADVNGQGATFVEPIMKFWTEEFRTRTADKVKINYTGTGSGAGITQMSKKLVAFGCSDAPMNAKQLAEAKATTGDFVHVPLVIGAVVPAYNLPGVEQPLAFTGPVLANIFTGKITMWNDPKLVALNPALKDKAVKIQPVTRADSSGTSFIFSDYLAKVSPEFKKEVGAATLPRWPKGSGSSQEKSSGVAGYIGRTEGAIGYIELTYALDSSEKLKYGSVLNKAGKQVLADLESITAAAAASLNKKQDAEPYSLHDLTYNLTDADEEKSYPIAGMSFAVIYKKLDGDQASGAKGKAVVAFLKWATSPEGQELAKKRNYAPLPADLQKKIADKLATVEVQ
jgi:phosphate ABC transporter phosphate-binding protein